MLYVLGDSFIAQHVEQCVAQETKERIYRLYITDALFAIVNKPSTMSKRWCEIDPGFSPVAPEADAEEIKTRLKAMINGKEELNEPV